MTFGDLKPLTITIYLSLIVTIPLSIMMGILGLMGLYIEVPILLVVLIFSGIYLYNSIINKKLHLLVLYPFVLIVSFLIGYIYDLHFTESTITSLKKFGNIVELYYKENKVFPNKENYSQLELDNNITIIKLNNDTFEIEFRDGIYNSFDHEVRLRSRP